MKVTIESRELDELLTELRGIRQLLRGLKGETMVTEPVREWLDHKTAAEYLQVYPETLYRWKDSNKIRHTWPGGLLLYKAEWLDEYLESRATGGTGPSPKAVVDEFLERGQKGRLKRGE